MTNDDPLYVRQLEAARDAAEIEIKALEDELKRCHEIIAEQQERINPMYMGEPLIEGAGEYKWKLVPVEPTPEMQRSGRWIGMGTMEESEPWTRDEIYRRYVAAAPTPPAVDMEGAPQSISVVKIEGMVDRFLGWKLPKDFCPDAGISFARTHNTYIDGKFTRDIERTPEDPTWPIGTNLLCADQALAMIEYMLGTPMVASPELAAEIDAAVKAGRIIDDRPAGIRSEVAKSSNENP